MRIRVAVAALVLVVPLAGCGSGNEAGPTPTPSPSAAVTPSESPSGTPSETPSAPTAKVADTLCVRIDQTLVQRTLDVSSVAIQTKPLPAELGLPTYDVCELQLGTGTPGGNLRIGVSVRPAKLTDLAASRATYNATRGSAEVAKDVIAGDGGFGTSRFVVVLDENRLVKVSGPAAKIEKYAALAAATLQNLPGLPEPEPLVARTECERGSSEAAAVLGAPASFRRDGETPTGDLICGWGTASTVLWTSEALVPEAARVMDTARKSPTAESIPLGDEALIDLKTLTVKMRVGDDRIVTMTRLPAGQADKNDMTAFALAMAGLYTN
ncbi:hypothetical protein [Kribbella deserti]|uniref:DUF3558 domain-containing protein n=1 Tax=Kribbella deserti TaxID=1926257 RepID=A0ABV6QSU7_9ACTN